MEQENRVETEIETSTAKAKAEATPSSTKAEAQAKPPYGGESTSSGGVDASNFASHNHGPSSQDQAAYPEAVNNPELAPESLFEASLGLRSIEIDDEVILIDLLGDKYFRLNATGTIIWRLILQRSSLQEISDQLAQRFSLAPDKAFDEASTFIASLIQSGLAIQQGELKQRS